MEKKNTGRDSNCPDNSLHNPFDARSGNLEGRTQRTTGMDGVAGRRNENFIRWCHRCKHEVPEYLEGDRCDLCGKTIKILGGNEK